MDNHASTAAEFAAELTFDALPERVTEEAALIVADSLAAIIGGSTTPYVAEFATDSAEQAGPASIFGTALQTTVDRAALVNGTAGSVLELDHGHKYSAGHPSMHVLPALFAEYESGTTVDSETFLTAFVAGYEVGARVGMASLPLDEQYHMHGIWGTVGAAVAVARMRGYDADTTLTAMRISANYALHTSFDAALDGATVRNTYMGASAMHGITTVDQATAGFTGLDDALHKHLNRLTANEFERELVINELGSRWETAHGYFKAHAACRYTHGALDALDEFDTTELDVEAIESVSVETYPSAARLTTKHPQTDLGAKFSIPFAVATRLLHDHSGKESFAKEALTDAAYDLAETVEVTANPAFAERVPDARSTRVTIRLADGETFSHEIERPQGDDENPFSKTELREKFQTLVAPVLDDETANRLWKTANNLPASEIPELLQLATE
jgi:2-methylcitrate dehydratase PrpD